MIATYAHYYQTTPQQPDIAGWFIQEYESEKYTATPRDRMNLLLGNAASVVVGGR